MDSLKLWAAQHFYEGHQEGKFHRKSSTMQLQPETAPVLAKSPTETSRKAGRSNCELSPFYLLVKTMKFFVDILTNNASEIYFPLTSYSFVSLQEQKPTTTQHACFKLTKRR